MGTVSTPALAAAVARTGALGMLGAAGVAAAELAATLRETRLAAGPSGRVGVNFLLPFLDLAAFEVAASSAPVIECFYGEPAADLVARAHAAGALAGWQVGSRREAVAAADAGCDYVVAQGVEAGGHVRGTQPVLALVEEVRAAVSVPVAAAGGMGSGAAIASALRAGADAVRLGTRLVATLEADAHRAYQDALVAAEANDTVITETFAFGWPDAPHRVLRSCVTASSDPSHLRSPQPPTRSFEGDVGSAALYAGASVSEVRRVEPAAAVIAELVADAAAALAGR